MFSFDFIKSRLNNHSPQTFPVTNTVKQASVAIVLRETPLDIDVLFIKRAEVQGDPWSGHMAFPGGHRDEKDENLVVAAIRETWEEIGLSLTQQNYLGSLSHQRPANRSRNRILQVAPYVFGIHDDPLLSPNHEVADVVWGSMQDMINGSIHATKKLHFGSGSGHFNGYELESNHFVWGLTYRTLQTLFSALDPTYIVPTDPRN